MRPLRTLTVLCLFMSFSFLSTAQRAALKGQIEAKFQKFEGRVTNEKINLLLAGLKALSPAEANMCFVSIADYNDCQDRAVVVYDQLSGYLDDLLDKDISVTEVRAVRPWEDEEYYTLSYKLSYINDNPEYPTDINFDQIDLGIQDNVIKDIIHSREWFGLSDYVKK